MLYLICIIDAKQQGKVLMKAVLNGPTLSNQSGNNPQSKVSNTAVAEYKVGSIVQANYRNKGKYFGAVVLADRGNGTYDLKYDDGIYLYALVI